MAYVISDDCIACGTCIDECPVEAISEGDIYSINPDVCTDSTRDALLPNGRKGRCRVFGGVLEPRYIVGAEPLDQ